MISQKDIEIVSWLQEQSIGAYLKVANSLQSGMSEWDIAHSLKQELQKTGIVHYWYDVPITVLIGPNRFKHMADTDYEIKSPRDTISLKENDVFFIDITSQESTQGRWGDFSATGVYKPKNNEHVKFIEHMQMIHQEGISHIHADIKGCEVFEWFKKRFDEENVKLIDPRSNVGHTIGFGTKQTYNRIFLDASDQIQMKDSLYAIEPGGIKGDLVSQFEDCMYVPKKGPAMILGRKEMLPVVFGL